MKKQYSEIDRLVSGHVPQSLSEKLVGRAVHGSDQIRRSAVKSAIRSEKCGSDPIRRECGSDTIRSAKAEHRISGLRETSAHTPLRHSLPPHRHTHRLHSHCLCAGAITRRSSSSYCCRLRFVAAQTRLSLTRRRSASRRFAGRCSALSCSTQTCQICSSACRLASLAVSHLRSSLPLVVTAYHLCLIAAFPLVSYVLHF
ncbi:hypothetical protein PIB30_045847 [Stylosanthes scabra]|uniref:Uncharacterized protein n=1 Tax=Stylosanthes scabra TaxID=79078 RepID=A0ABU6WEQ9_9FABA|nr:hypothetical protein [Stylosanthes scabra]